MKGYKIFGPNFTCRGYKFQENNICEGPLEICSRGFHFCTKAIDCLRYYEYLPTNTYAEVESIGPIQEKDDKVVCLELKIVRKLSYEEFGKLLTGTIKTPDTEKNYVNGIKHGVFKEYYFDGPIKKEYKYVDGVLSGTYKSYHDNGQLYCYGYYSLGELDGKYNEYDENGILRRYIEYADGYIMSMKKYDNDGNQEDYQEEDC